MKPEQILQNLHLLRHWWLLALVPVGILYWLWLRRQQITAHWQRSFDPELLSVLLDDNRSSRGKRANWPLLLVLVAALLGLAGPAFERLPQPVEQQSDALVIALDLSLSMYAQDIAPSRLTRARQKIIDVLRGRQEGVTGLVAWAGSAHAVAPLTDDTRTIENLLESLEPAIMPVAGSRPAAALEVVSTLFANAHMSQGRILFVTDGIDNLADITDYRDPRFPISILGMGTPEGAPIPLDFVEQPGRFLTTREGEVITARLDEERLAESAELGYGQYARVVLGDSDLEIVLGTTLPDDDELSQVEREFDLWHDLGYWLAAIALPLLLFGFRRGVVAGLALLVMPFDSHAGIWENLWQRDDQQAYAALNAGEPERAATLTERKDWRGVAEYRAGNYSSAVGSFTGLDDVRNTYNLGTALARAGDLDGAIAAYDSVLTREPEHEDAAFNKALLEKQKQAEQQASEQDNSEQQQDSENQSDQSRNGDSSGGNQQEPDSREPGAEDATEPGQEEQSQAKRGEPGEPEAADQEQRAQSRDEQADAMEQWLRRVPDDPGGLLRRKFQYENQQRLREGDYRYRQGDKIW